MWLRAYGLFLVPAVLILVIGDVFNTFRAASGSSYLDGLPGPVLAALSPFGVVALLGMATAYGSWRTERWQGGFVAALGMSIVVWVFMAAWESATFYSFARAQASNPYWVQAWHWSTNRAGTPDETFQHWIFWDNVGALIIAGVALLVTSLACGGLAAIVGVMSRRHSSATH